MSTPPKPRESTRTQPQRPLDTTSASGPVASSTCLLILAVALSVLILHSLSYLPFFEDDSFISLRYAQRFIEGKGLTWNDGERVEGYSNLLWVLLLSAPGKLGIDLVSAARALGVALMGAAIGAVVYAYPPRRGVKRSAWPAFMGVIMLACCGSFAIWGIGGLEQPLLVALLAWAIVLILPLYDGDNIPRRRLIIAALLLGLAVLTRPDAPIFVVVIVACLLICRRFHCSAWLPAALLAGIPMAFYAGQLIFRLSYYGDWVPNTAYVKVTLSATRIQQGFFYCLFGLLAISPMVLLAILGIGSSANAHRRGRILLLLALTLTWLAYVCFIGGDVFGGYRHLVVVIWLLAVLACAGVAFLTQRLGSEFRLAAAVMLFAPLLLLGQQFTDTENLYARHETWEWGAQAAANMFLKLWPSRRPLMAIDAAGALPYFTGYPCVDMLGLNDRHIARHRPESMGSGWVGHELGDGQYVLDRRPDIVIFGSLSKAMEPSFPSGRQMLALREFHQWYQPVLFTYETAFGRADEQVCWLRREESRVGIERADGRIRVPGYLFAPASQVRRNFSEVFSPQVQPAVPTYSRGLCAGFEGHYGVPIDPGQVSILVDLPVGPGTWRLKTNPPYKQLRISVSPAAGPNAICSGQGGCTLKLDAPAMVDVRLEHSLNESLLVEDMTLTKE